MKYKFKISVLFVALICFTITSIFAQFSRNDAINFVLNTILADDVGKIDVYVSNNSFTSDVELIDNDSQTNPYAECWVFFSDDNPFASWYHSSRIIFVSAVDGSYITNNVEIYPKNLNIDYEEVSTATRPDPIAMDGTPFVPDSQKAESNYNYALIIVSMDNPRNWYNTSLIYNVLIDNYNYQADNIFVLYSWDGNSTATPNFNNLDNDVPINDIDGEATWENIQNVIDNLTGEETNLPWVPKMEHGDQLAVFFTGVPVDNTFAEPRLGFLPENGGFLQLYDVSDISEPMEDIDCGQMIFTLDVNFSSDVAWFFSEANGTNVKCKNRYLHGPAGSDEFSRAEMYFSGGNYSEQLFYWASAARGYLPDVFGQAPWNVWEDFGQLGLENGGGDYSIYLPNHPGDTYLDDNLDSFIQLGEAFQYANDMNTWSDNGYCYIPYDPSVPPETPHQKDEFPFNEDLITLAGLSGHVTFSPQNLPSRSYILVDEFYIDPYVTLSFEDETELYIAKNKYDKNVYVKIYFLENSIGYFGKDMIITTAIEPYNPFFDPFVVNFWGAIIELDIGTYFYKVSLMINSNLNNIHLDNVNFGSCAINLKANNVLVENCSFVYTSLSNIQTRALTLDNCYFNQSIAGFIGLGVFAQSNDYIHILNCELYGKNNEIPTPYSLFIKDIPNYIINHTVITDGISGMYIGNSGWETDNIISNNGIYDNWNDGLIIYNSKAELSNNAINDNSWTGLKLNNYSLVSIVGNESAHYVSETQ